MPTFVILARYTQQGIENIRDSPSRLGEAKERLFDPLGVEVKVLHLVTGRYDLVGIVEAPDGEAMAKLALSLSAQGNVRTEVLQAFDYQQLVGALPQ